MFNPQLTEDIALDPAVELVLDMQTQSAIYTNCVETFNDPRIVATNPWLPALLGNTTVPIIKAFGCGTAESAPMTNFLGLFHERARASSGQDGDLQRCSAAALKAGSAYYKAVATCNPGPNGTIIFTQTEAAAPVLAMGTMGATAFSMRDDDTSSRFSKLIVNRNGVQSVTSSPHEGVLACASDTFDAQTISFDFSKSKDPRCWPMSHHLVAIVRKQY
jgi:hypothetical protein